VLLEVDLCVCSVVWTGWLFVSGTYGEHAALKAWSQEGQLITLDLNFYYRLDRDNIISMSTPPLLRLASLISHHSLLVVDGLWFSSY
jgi:hypothetical protein